MTMILKPSQCVDALEPVTLNDAKYLRPNAQGWGQTLEAEAKILTQRLGRCEKFGFRAEERRSIPRPLLQGQGRIVGLGSNLVLSRNGSDLNFYRATLC